jgi:KDO2-lipid IV(A) lauroyltransferase
MFMRKIKHIVEYIVLKTFFSVSTALGVEKASALGGWIGRLVGPRLAASRKALANVKAALPDLNDEQYRKIITDMWDNLGRVMAEYPHLAEIARSRTEVVTLERVRQIGTDGQPGIVIAGHLANWEVAGPTAYVQGGFELDLVYRAPNNPYADDLLKKLRQIAPELRAMPKSQAGARDIMRSLKDGRHIGILIDQKYNEGIPALFFGRPAMTSPAFVQLAQRFKCPLVMARLERLNDGPNFRITTVDIPCTDAAGQNLPVETVVAAAHKHLEDWILERPGQWLWLHRRWSERAEREFSK